MERTVGQHRCTSGNVESYLCRWHWGRGGVKASRRQGISATDEQTTTIATGECDSVHWGGGGDGKGREPAAVLHSGRKAFNRQQHIRF